MPPAPTPGRSDETGTDPIFILSEAIKVVMRSVKDAATSEKDSRLESRVKAAKHLPEFSGDPLEWTHFKEIYEESTKLCGYSDRENIARLFKAVQGEARNSVKTLLATTRSACAIMETLELHFGNRNAVAGRILTEIRDLPQLEARALNIAQFATKLRNAVTALKSLNFSEYLSSPDLMRSVWSKLPDEMKYTFNRHVRENRNSLSSEDGSLVLDKTNFETLAEFLYGEAECAQLSGAMDWETASSATLGWASEPTAKSAAKAPYVRENKRPANHGRPAVVCANVERAGDSKGNGREKARDFCVHCNRDGHEVRECNEFAKESPKRRWFLAKRRRLCYKCLRTGHSQYRCGEDTVCDACQRPHHSLIHLDQNDWAEMERGHLGRKGRKSARSTGSSDGRDEPK